MSDSEDAFESADEGAEEKKENEEKQNIVTPPAKATAKETLPQATGGLNLAIFLPDKMMVLGDRHLLLILEFFTIVMYGES